MANIENKNSLAWVGTSSAMCTDISIGGLTDKLQIAYIGSQNGASVPSSDPFSAGLGLSYQNLECGVSGLVYSLQVPYEIGNVVEADYKVDQGRLGVNYPMQVVLKGGEGEGTYKITSQFKNNKPVYKNGEWWLWWDGASSWVISTPDLNKDGKFYVNNKPAPNNGPYNSDPQNFVDPNDCIAVSGFDGDVATANGSYCPITIVNEKTAYKHSTNEWYIFWHPEVPLAEGGTVARWVLTNSPYNLMGEYITNGSGEKPGKFEGLPCSAGFVDKVGVVEGTIPDGSLATEDGSEAVALLVEDTNAVITIEK